MYRNPRRSRLDQCSNAYVSQPETKDHNLLCDLRPRRLLLYFLGALATGLSIHLHYNYGALQARFGTQFTF